METTNQTTVSPKAESVDYAAALRHYSRYGRGRSMRKFSEDEGHDYWKFCKYARSGQAELNIRAGGHCISVDSWFLVDDFRESPTLQLLEAQERHLARPLKCYDPFLENHKIAENQYSDFDEFLSELDMVVIMVKHDHIKPNWDKLRGKVILDCFNICPLEEKVYHI